MPQHMSHLALSQTMHLARTALYRWSSIPQYWRWLGWTDFLRYGWGSLMINHVSVLDSQLCCTCSPVAQVYPLPLLASPHLDCCAACSLQASVMSSFLGRLS